LDLVESRIEEKIRIMNQLKDEVDELRRRKREVDDVSKLLGGKPSYNKQQFMGPAQQQQSNNKNYFQNNNAM